MKLGEKAKLTIPWQLDMGIEDILDFRFPSDLVFELEV